jgi:hypothetical protein
MTYLQEGRSFFCKHNKRPEWMEAETDFATTVSFVRIISKVTWKVGERVEGVREVTRTI